MEIKTFTHLHVHSDYSLQDGYGTIKEYIQAAKEDGQKALALTDHNTMTGIYQFIKNCKKEGIKPIAGVEMNLAPKNIDGVFTKEIIQYNKSKPYIVKGVATHLTLLAKNDKGLRNLFFLNKLSYEQNRYLIVPRIGLEDLAQYSEGIICLTGCPRSEINIRLRLGEYEKAKSELERLKDIFKGDLYVELMLLEGPTDYSLANLMKLARDCNVEMVITNDVHYCKKENAEIHEKLLAMGNKNKMSETPSTFGGLRFKFPDEEHYLKSSKEMIKAYKDYAPKILEDLINNHNMSTLKIDIINKMLIDSLQNTFKIANKIEDLNIEYNSHLRPVVELPEGFNTTFDYLKFLVDEGFKKKRSNSPKEVQEISLQKQKEELEVLLSNDFVDYFITVKDYIDWTRNQGYGVGVGRGSVGGSEIAYLLDISRTDPIRFNLMFERFISPGRGAIYEIEYEDGTKETLNVTNKKKTSNGEKYIYQLNIGDEIHETSI